MILPDNEGRACDAVVRILEKLTRNTRADIRCPDKEGEKPPVDLRLKLGPQAYAIEHTRIESQENHISKFVNANEIIRFVQEKIPDPFPTLAYYELQFPVDVSMPKTRRKKIRALGKLITWVHEQVKILNERNSDLFCPVCDPHMASDRVRGIPDGFNREFELLYWPAVLVAGRDPGILSFRFIPPNDPEDLRVKSLCQTFLKKCPKLQECKMEGARTVLVLESSDPSLTSFEFRGSLLPSVLSQNTNAPDEIFLVETRRTDHWLVTLLKRDGSHWPEKGMPELGRFYYDPDTSDIPDYLASIPKHERDAFQLDKLYTPTLRGWARERFNRDELIDLMVECDGVR